MMPQRVGSHRLGAKSASDDYFFSSLCSLWFSFSSFLLLFFSPSLLISFIRSVALTCVAGTASSDNKSSVWPREQVSFEGRLLARPNRRWGYRTSASLDLTPLARRHLSVASPARALARLANA
jgi:hypothetical protein